MASMEELPERTTARSLARATFPDRGRWPGINYHLSELRWVDAAHMDERSAIIVAQEIDRFLSRLPPSP